jgi:tetratricopeptide (TPR) repeat protein
MMPFRSRCVVSLVMAAVCAAAVLAHAQAPAPEAQLAQAKAQFEAGDYEPAIATLDPLIVMLEPLAVKDPVAKRLLPAAYELRARTRFQLGNADGAAADFRALLKLAPAFTFTDKVSPKVAKTLEDIRKTAVGTIVLNLSPVDAELELDGQPFAAAAGQIPLPVGPHTLSGRRSGCRSASQTFTVMPAASTEVVLTLERVSATVFLVTSPPGIEVTVDGASRGRTEPGPQPPRWAEPIASLGVPPGAVSKPFVVDDLGLGWHTFSFSRDCHVGMDLRAEITKLTDLYLAPVKLDRAVASVYVDAPGTGAVIVLDGESRGPVPQQIDDICEGSHVIELRSPLGRYVERLTTRAGDKLNVQGVLKPAVALLAVTGLPKEYRGADLRLELERRFVAAKSMTIFAPAPEKVQQAMNAERLTPGWLAFDRWRGPIGTNAEAITPSARLDLGGKLSKALEVQGVAELTARPGGDRQQFMLSILAADSSSPDVLEVIPDNPASVNAVIARLDQVPAMYRPTAGLTVADILDVAGAVVVSVDAAGAAAKAGIAPGDVIVKADGQPVADAARFSAALAAHKANDNMAVDVQARAGGVRPATLTISMTPRLVAMSDQSLLFNNLAIVLRTRLAQSPGGAPDPVVRLNLAVALMRLGNYQDARAELSKIKLTAGPGVSNGTVQYLLGLCYEALGQAAEAAQAWRAAATDADALLTEDGPFVKELAEAKLAGGGRK